MSQAPHTLKLLKHMIGTIFISLFIRAVRRFAEYTYLAALPVMAISLHSSRGALQITMLSFFIGVFIMQISSVVVDRYISLYQHLLLSALAIIAGCFTILYTNQIAIISIGRFFEGLGAGILFSISNSLIYNKAKIYFPDAIKSVTKRSLAFVGAFSAWIPSLAIILGGALLVSYSWHASFYAVLAMAIILLCISVLVKASHISDHIAQGHLPVWRSYAHIIFNRHYLSLTIPFSLINAAVASYFVMIFFLFPHANKSTLVHVSLFALAPAFGHFVGKIISVYELRASNKFLPLVVGYGLCCLTSIMFFTLVELHIMSITLIVIHVILFSIGAGIATPNTLSIILHDFSSLKVLASALFYAISNLIAIISIWIIAHTGLNSIVSLALIFLCFSVVALAVILIMNSRA